ncbi:MAG: cation-translocating P-type ATPase C-terminal domain-containing protein [Bacilli bacterium]|nr:cation-translocating P-type ATPase C-terminal domain-containing protein [Bacilli bacterium]
MLLFPIHIVLLELIIDPTASIVFERCQADKDIMKKNPRNINEKLLNYKNIITYIIQGLIISISFIGSYIYMIKNGYSQELALTFSISTLILSNLFIVFVNSSKDLSINNFISTLKDKVILRVVLGIVLLLFIIIYVPFFQKIVGTTPLSIYQLLLTIIVAVISTIWYDLIKIINKNKL